MRNQLECGASKLFLTSQIPQGSGGFFVLHRSDSQHQHLADFSELPIWTQALQPAALPQTSLCMAAKVSSVVFGLSSVPKVRWIWWGRGGCKSNQNIFCKVSHSWVITLCIAHGPSLELVSSFLQDQPKLELITSLQVTVFIQR